MNYKGTDVSGLFTFNEKGVVIHFVGKRYTNSNGQYTLAGWSVQMKEPKEYSGIMIPSKGEFTWNLKTGDFDWFQFELKDVEYNKSPVYYGIGPCNSRLAELSVQITI